MKNLREKAVGAESDAVTYEKQVEVLVGTSAWRHKLKLYSHARATIEILRRESRYFDPMSLICNSPAGAGYTPGMDGSPDRFPDTEAMLRASRPREPVYCLFPHVYAENAARFVAGFPGRVLYAVKANDHPDVILSLIHI